METQQQSRIAYRLKCEKRLYLSSVIGLGIIPANAGSLNSWQSRPWYTGSSPRMRGAQCRSPPKMRRSGIIPADAGSTNQRRRRHRGTEDHPRGCGEHQAPNTSMDFKSGSSPRMRGVPAVLVEVDTELRIIPADAGSTDGQVLKRLLHADHPRGCGEHKFHRSSWL